jgi:L-threonylcarbamoyladenylate synthase
MAGGLEETVAAIRAGKPVLLPTDTVYGLCADVYRSDPVLELFRLKGRDVLQPVALLAADVGMLFECVPELRGRAGTLARAILPGPYTLILPNPARRFRWLTGSNPDAIGVRVAELPPGTQAVLDRVGCVGATSANLHGGPDPRTLDEVPDAIRSACAAEIDEGELRGTPSTVLDLTGPEPKVLRRGAGDVEAALERIRSVIV